MRIPAAVLDTRLEGAKLGTTNARGAELGPYSPFRAVVDERATLRVDQRPDTDTAGQPIEVSVQVIAQLDRYLPPGSLIRLADGSIVTVANAATHSHRAGPSSAEMWCVR